MTPTQRSLARHALGLPNDQKRSYRNRYFASHGGPIHQDWSGLVAAGLAQPSDNSGSSLAMFELTLSGAQAALDPGETLDMEDF